MVTFNKQALRYSEGGPHDSLKFGLCVKNNSSSKKGTKWQCLVAALKSYALDTCLCFET